MTSNKKDLHSKEKLLISDLSNHFENTCTNKKGSYIKEVVAATGYSRSTIFRVRKELRENGKLKSPQRPKRRGDYKPIDEFDKTVIRNKFHQFYEVRRQLPTLKMLHSQLKTEINYPGSIWHLNKTIRKLGFNWKQTQDNKKVLMEKPAVVAQRMKFYRRKTELEEKGYSLVYVDETWVDTSYTAKRCWQSESLSGVKAPMNRGQRLIVVNAGSRKGFIDGAQLVYKASSCTGDYHREMNGDNFTKWIKEKLLPNLDTPSAIVMDNASYHSVQSEKCPTSSSKKADIQEWLQKHTVTYKTSMVKSKLLELVKAHKPAPSYTIDTIIRSQGHEILRLPPYHPEFNAIKLIWSQLKYIVRSRNVTFRLDNVQQLVSEAFSEIGQNRWQHACDHVEKAIKEMKNRDLYKDVQSQECMIIDFEDDTTDTASMGSSTDTASEID